MMFVFTRAADTRRQPLDCGGLTPLFLRRGWEGPRIDASRDARQLPGMELGTKIVGTRRRATDPASCHRRALMLMREAEKICPFPRPRGFVFKARTWGEYEAWKKAQPNPRLW